MFRRATNAERAMAQTMIDELRPVDYRATGTLQRSVDPSGRITRDDFDALLEAMVRAGLIAIEDAEFEKDGEVRRYRKVRLTEAGLQTRNIAQVELLLDDGIAEEFAATESQKRLRKVAKRDKSPQAADANRTSTRATRSIDREVSSQTLSADGEALMVRLKDWRTSEAKRLRIPAYCVMHDRTLNAVAFSRPTNPRQLLEIDGIGPTKVEKFGPAILEICGAKLITEH
jgi:superfamily II DNA helicase RecQ